MPTCVQYHGKYAGNGTKSPSLHLWDTSNQKCLAFSVHWNIEILKARFYSDALREYSYIPMKTEVMFISKRCSAFTSSFSREGWRRLEACCCQETEHCQGSINGSQPEHEQKQSHVLHIWRPNWNAAYIPNFLIMQLFNNNFLIMFAYLTF